jgi:hypothetical protein
MQANASEEGVQPGQASLEGLEENQAEQNGERAVKKSGDLGDGDLV